MIEIPVLNPKGEKIGSEQLDPADFGGKVRYNLLKQAVVAYRAALRLGTSATKSRAMVHGASRKLYKQKGTGNARAGNLRTPVRRGGGHAFHKINRDFTQKMNRKMRRLARNSAILAKAMSGSAMILSGLKVDAPKTKFLAQALKANKANTGALMAFDSIERNMVLSGRNIEGFSMKLVSEVNAYDVLKARRLIFTPEAFKALAADPQKFGKTAEA